MITVTFTGFVPRPGKVESGQFVEQFAASFIPRKGEAVYFRLGTETTGEETDPDIVIAGCTFVTQNVVHHFGPRGHEEIDVNLGAAIGTEGRK